MPTCTSLMLFYDDASRAAIPPGFTGLDNTAPADLTLFEIEPMLRYLESHPIDDAHYYGFFSPRVMAKTGLDAEQILAAAGRIRRCHDICSISPFPGYLSRHDNPVAQGESAHPGLRMRYEAICHLLPEPLQHSAQTYASTPLPLQYFLMSHYFWATGAFWKRWASLVRGLLDSTASDPELNALLNTPCYYEGASLDTYTFKVFLLERMAGLTALHYRQRISRPWLLQIWRHGMTINGGFTPGQAVLNLLKRRLRGVLARWRHRRG